MALGYQGSSISMYFMSGGAPGVVQVGASGRGTLPQPPRIRVRKLEPSGFRLTVSDAEPGLPSFLVLGFSQPPVPAIHLPSLGFPGCTLQPSPDLYGVPIVGSTGMAAGYAAYDFVQQLVATPGLGSFALWAQWVTFGQTWAGGVSEAIRMHVQ